MCLDYEWCFRRGPASGNGRNFFGCRGSELERMKSWVYGQCQPETPKVIYGFVHRIDWREEEHAIF